MGCVVNGPGEARDADVGVAGGRDKGVIFRHGEIVRTVTEGDLFGAICEEIDTVVREREAEAAELVPADSWPAATRLSVNCTFSNYRRHPVCASGIFLGGGLNGHRTAIFD